MFSYIRMQFGFITGDTAKGESKSAGKEMAGRDGTKPIMRHEFNY